ncbi:glycosyltransferase [Burkholderia stagnalis]|uniref:Glycosyltransferase n=1 Tax=Burkholderia stagnalis TaxID=1503054 RepID=A0ABX9YEJ1_9BURK|nr:glycosyltransferase [Burkholderia stagnalis]RQQ44462.1 glycosyltransferase [Burkholderia stagnalis]RQQ57908.1 glycosyltransferase [Burkholderia stagnalis]RQQ58041.1 glycosyltransferase [Burkholderia stagnalis]RQQ71416.1 glycosyltransferase [Burkholderia stagnalis]RQQ78368.1 glycosyltransferase [Burkholderia stagnalis]
MYSKLKIDASVVIAVCNDLRVSRLLETLKSQDCQPYAFEILVIENGTHDLEDICNRFREDITIRYYHQEAPNSAAARNIGLKHARGRYILMTDADVIVTNTWVRRLIESLDNSNHGAVGGAIRKASMDTWVQKSAITIVDGQSLLSYLPASPYPYVVGANVAYRAQLVREVGGFDEELKSGADVDICYKLGYAGQTIGLAPEAIIYHEDRSTLRKHFQRFAFYAEYQVLLFAKYRHLTEKKFVLNSYPLKRALLAIALVPGAVVLVLLGRFTLIQKAITQLVEAAGIWWGSIKGAFKHRQFYI